MVDSCSDRGKGALPSNVALYYISDSKFTIHRLKDIDDLDAVECNHILHQHFVSRWTWTTMLSGTVSSSSILVEATDASSTAST